MESARARLRRLFAISLSVNAMAGAHTGGIPRALTAGIDARGGGSSHRVIAALPGCFPEVSDAPRIETRSQNWIGEEMRSAMARRWLVVSGVVLAASLALTTGCGTSNSVKGGAIGAGAGGVLGGVIGNQAGNTAVGAIIGAAVGGTTGALIGRHMDKQAEEMQRDLQNARIERIGEGIKITFDSGILFDYDSAALRPLARTNINDLVVILNRYPDTNIVVEGDTDNTGSESYNQGLSERRAWAVANQLMAGSVAGSRVSTMGLGETNPVASNNTDSGRQLNRRVEIAIFANDKLKNAIGNNNG
jgi:outer membrane protein OmpA-like peptidoglycan-associated protein